ncbi:hypothetical protein Emed_005390 [Eimeria media]
MGLSPTPRSLCRLLLYIERPDLRSTADPESAAGKSSSAAATLATETRCEGQEQQETWEDAPTPGGGVGLAHATVGRSVGQGHTAAGACRKQGERLPEGGMNVDSEDGGNSSCVEQQTEEDAIEDLSAGIILDTRLDQAATSTGRSAILPPPTNAEDVQQHPAPETYKEERVPCPICSRLFFNKRGLAQHLPRDANNSCAAAEAPTQSSFTPPASQPRPTRARPQQEQQPITRKKALRIPRLTEATRKKLIEQLTAIASETTAKVTRATWEAVEEAATNSFTTAIYDAMWSAHKPTNARPDHNSKDKSAQKGNSYPRSPNPQDTRQPRDLPRVAQAKDNVDKALSALRQGEARRQQRGPQAASHVDRLRKRALKHKLRQARRRVITALKEESAHNLQRLYMRSMKRCVDQLFADQNQPPIHYCTIPLGELEQYYRRQHSPQQIDFNSEDARDFLQGLKRASAAVRLDLHFTENEVRAQLQKRNLQSAAGPDGIGFLVYRRFEDVLVPPLAGLPSMHALPTDECPGSGRRA